MKKKILYIQRVGFEYNRIDKIFCSPYANAGYDIDCIEVKELPEDLSFRTHELIIIPGLVDQVMLERKKHWLNNFWNSGGSFIVNHQIILPFLPFLKTFIAIPHPSVSDFIVRPYNKNSIFENINFDRLSNKKGVYGFYGVGHNPPPKNAVILNTIGRGYYAIDWYLKGPNMALFFSHGGNDISMFHSDINDDPNLTHKLLQWIMKELK